MKRKFSTKRILRFFLIVETLFLFLVTYQVISGFFPGTKTYKTDTNWRPNPTWKGGLHSTFTLKQDFSFQNISYPNLAFHAMKDNTDYWMNVTSGSNANINVWQWFTSSSTVFEFTSTGTYNATLDVGSLGEPTSITGADTSSYASNQINFTVTASSSQFVYFLWESYSYTFHGPYNETTGLLIPSGVNVTAHFTDGNNTETFLVNGTYNWASSSQPEYFHYDFTEDREYWISDADSTPEEIWIFDDDTTHYTIVFLDLAGALDDYPYVYAEYYVNGTLYTVEKRKVDAEKKIQMSLVNGRKYLLKIIDGSSYTFGDLLMTSTTTIQLTLKGIEFPKDTLLTFMYVRIYALRGFNSPNGNITFIYQDTLNMTNQVELFINYKNGTNAYNATETTSSFSHVWASALNNTDYAGVVNINHSRYGVYSWKQYFPRSFSEPPWPLAFLGSLPFDTSLIVPMLLILFAGGSFSVINAEVGAFMAVLVAAILTYLGWIAISPGLLITAFCLAIFMGIIYAKRRITV